MMDWRKILVAVDDTPTCEKALHYVGQLAGHLPETRICLLHIYPEPPPDYYNSGKSFDEYRAEKEKKADNLFQRASATLTESGIAREDITTLCRMADHATISEAILAAQEEGKYGTVVVGKRGVSKAEEFLFGSISNALIHNSRNIAVWVIG